MEDFVTVTMSREDLDRLLAAADAAGLHVVEYMRRAALATAEAEAIVRKQSQELEPRKRAIIAAYLRVMGLKGPEVLDHGRMAKAAKAAAAAGRNPDELEAVAGWLRQQDNRWRGGRRIPLEEIVGQWAAWAQSAGPVRAAAPVETPHAADAGDDADAIMGEIIWE